MADEQKDQNQEEAVAKTSVPDSVQANGGIVQRGEYLKMEADNVDTFKKYGESTMVGFMNKVGSDGVFAQKVVTNLLFKSEGKDGFVVGISPDSPQEFNLTGVVDHTEPIAKKLAGTAAENIAPTAGVNTDVAPTPVE